MDKYPIMTQSTSEIRLSNLAEKTATPSGVYGYRKFIVALVALVGNTLLAWFGRIDPGVYSVVAVAVISAYVAGNVIQHNQNRSSQ